jgi:hypothetical protein
MALKSSFLKVTKQCVPIDLVKLCKNYEPSKLQDNITLGFQEHTLKFLRKMTF